MANRSASQVANRRRVERLIRLAAPALDLLLYTGDRLSRVSGRNEIPPEPARRGISSSVLASSDVVRRYTP
jgi:hypothetical protein